jgi:hypothetical protein
MSSFYDCSQVVDIADEPHHHLVIANEYVRAFAVEIPPRTRTLCHHHPYEYLLYVAQGAEIISAARDEEPKRLSYADGECELSKAGLVHVVDNLGDGAFRNIVVEPLPAAGRRKRGVKPLVMKGSAQIGEVLSEAPGAVFTVRMEPGAEVEIAGPAVVAAPYEPVMVKELEVFDIPLDDFRKLMWVCAPRKVRVRSAGTRAARLVAISLGVPSK